MYCSVHCITASTGVLIPKPCAMFAEHIALLSRSSKISLVYVVLPDTHRLCAQMSAIV